MFQLILFSMINRKRFSLRVMEEFLKSSSFRALSNHPEIDGKFNSLSDRIALIRPEYFEKIYYYVYDTFSKYLNEKDSIHRYDSTMVAVSSKLFTEKMRVARTAGKDKKQFKFTLGVHGSLPSYLEVFKDQIQDPNGIRVMMYMTLITSILIIAFRKLNKLTSYKIAKLRFALELENSVIAQIVLLCDGDLSKFNELFDP